MASLRPLCFASSRLGDRRHVPQVHTPGVVKSHGDRGPQFQHLGGANIQRGSGGTALSQQRRPRLKIAQCRPRFWNIPECGGEKMLIQAFLVGLSIDVQSKPASTGQTLSSVAVHPVQTRPKSPYATRAGSGIRFPLCPLSCSVQEFR